MYLSAKSITLFNFPHGYGARAVIIWGILALLAVGLSNCGSRSDPDWIARVGNETISLADFRRFYEFDPNFGADSSGPGALHDELQKYIDYSLAYLRAAREGQLDSATFARARQWEWRQAMLRQLYREKIRNPLQIEESDLRQAFVEYHTELHVRHLFARDERQIRAWQDSLQAGVPFASLARQAFRDSALAASGGDLGWVKAGDLDEDFAAAALALGQGEISPPVRTRWGHHLIQLLDRKSPVLLTEESFLAQRPSLEKRVRRKREARAANRFISEYVGTRNPQPVPDAFQHLWQALKRDSGGEQPRLQWEMVLDDPTLNRVQQQLQGKWQEPLVRYAGGEISLEAYLQAVAQMPPGDRPQFTTPRQLSNHLGRWVRDELLLREARRLQLDRHPRVQKEVREFMNEYAYLYFLNREIGAITVPAAVRQYFEAPPPARKIPLDFPEVRRFHTLQNWLWWQGEHRLHQKLRQMSVPVEIDYQKLQQENQAIDWQRRVPMFVLRKPS